MLKIICYYIVMGTLPETFSRELIHMKITSITEIAELAGVGTSTVSRVINNRSDVSPQTKEKVMAVIKKYHFEPNDNARNLKQINSKTICVVVNGTFNPFFSRVIEIIQQKIEENKYTPLVRYIEEGKDEYNAAKRLMNEKKAAGIIFLGGNAVSRNYITENPEIPFVFATTSAKKVNYSNISSVCVDDFNSAKSAVDYLFDCGHTKIAVIGGKRQSIDLVAFRLQGVQKSFEEHGVHFDESLYMESRFSMTDAYTAVSKVINKREFTALFAMSDIMAIGAAKAICDAGLKVPDDISIIGFDGIEMSLFYNPTLATIRQPADEIAIKSVELLMQNINGINLDNKHIVLESSIVKGGSVKTINEN